MLTNITKKASQREDSQNEKAGKEADSDAELTE
jgi:hypothetical protein